jgi:predicted nucleic acid-binding Zn finger protein
VLGCRDAGYFLVATHPCTVEGDFCTCRDYLYRLSRNGGLSSHSLSVRNAGATGQFELVNEWYSDHILRREYGESQS